MNLKQKITLLHITVSFVSALFIYMVYDSYIRSQEKEVEDKLMKVLKLNEDHMKRSLANIQSLLASQKELTKKMHLKIQEKLTITPNLSLSKLKKEISQEFAIKNENLDIEIFLVNKNYIIKNSTHKKNLGLSLKHIEKSKASIDRLDHIGAFEQSDDVAVDFLDYEIKSFSYSKLNENFFLGLGVIYQKAIDERESFNEMITISNTKMDMFCIIKDSQGNEYYESLIAHQKKFSTNEEYLASKEKFPIAKQTDNLIINTSRQWDIQNKENGNFLYLYIPLVKEKNQMMSIPGNIVFQVTLDISEQKLFFETIINKLVLFILLHFFLVFIIFYFTNKYQKLEKKLHKEIEKNTNLLEYNKQFISNLVHQIRTPLAVIMTNISLLEVMMKKNIKQYTFQINASINMLSNSYENLSYYVSFKNLEYPKRKINTSEFIQERIGFFDDIAYANKKNLISNIEPNIFCEFNDIELERLIDNLIVTSLHFCDYDGKVVIAFTKRENITSLKLKVLNINNSVDIDILNKKDKDYLQELSSFNLGLYIIRYITKINLVKYSFTKEKNHLVFKCSSM